MGFRFGRGLMEMIEGFMHCLARAEGPLHFALGTGRDAAAIAAAGHMRAHVHPQIPHHLLKDETACDGPVIHIQHVRDALKGEGLGVLGSHGGKEKPQGGLDLFAVDAVLFLVGQPTAVIHDAIEHEQGTAAPVLHPHRRLDVFEIGRTQIKMPTLIAVLRLEATGRRLLEEC